MLSMLLNIVRDRNSRNRRISRIQPDSKLRTIGLPLLLVTSLAPFSAGFAAPLTLSFRAVITSVLAGESSDVGMDFDVGDPLLGRFTFEPAESVTGDILFTTFQMYPFALNINGVAAASSGFELSAFNDAGIDDFPPASIVDGLELAAFFSHSSAPTINPSRSGMRMFLKSDVSVLSEKNYPSDADTWNAFHLERQLILRLQGFNGEFVGAQALIEDFAIVPEPITALHLCIVLIVPGFRHWMPFDRLEGSN
jgi:hypothetical protein